MKMKLKEIQETLLKNSLFDIEITTRCNKSCWMCPRESFIRKKEDMNEEVFDCVVNWLPENSSVFLAGFGEPTLNPLLKNYIFKLSQKNISSSLITNGKKLHASFICELFEKGLNKLKISFIIPSEIKNLFNFLKTNPTDFKRQIVLIFLVEESTLEIENFKSLAEYYEYTFEYKKIHNRGGYLYPIKQNHFITCGTFFKVIYINTKGEIQICSNDINNLNCIGDIFTMSHLDVINYKINFLGEKKIADLCTFCNDEYRFIHLKNPYL